MTSETGLLIGVLALISIGLFSSFYGYRVLRLALALLGLSYGITLGTTMMPGNQLWAEVIGGLIGGLVGAALGWGVFYLGTAFLGGLVGAVVVGTAIAALLQVTALSINPLVAALVVAALFVGGLLGAKLAHPFIVAATAVAGANSVVQGIAIFSPRWFPRHEMSTIAYVLLALVWLAVLVAGARYQLGSTHAEYMDAMPRHA